MLITYHYISENNMIKLEINEFNLEEKMNFENEKQTYYEVIRKFLVNELFGLRLDSDLTFSQNVENLSNKVLNLARELQILAKSQES